MIVGVYALLFCGGDILEVCWTEGLLAVQSLGNQDDVGLHVACLWRKMRIFWRYVGLRDF